jgi:hypothetical protein
MKSFRTKDLAMPYCSVIDPAVYPGMVPPAEDRIKIYQEVIFK